MLIGELIKRLQEIDEKTKGYANVYLQVYSGNCKDFDFRLLALSNVDEINLTKGRDVYLTGYSKKY